MYFFVKLKQYLHNTLRILNKNKSLKPLYNCSRDFFIWWKYQNPERNSLTDQMPWIAFAAIRFLKKQVKEDMVIYEWGSGGSTLFWVNHAKEVVSIEHHEGWFLKVADILKDKKITTVDYKLIEPEKDPDYDKTKIADPLAYVSDDDDYQGMSFKKYASDIGQYPDAYFDFIIVDGRARPSCLYHSLQKVKPCGYLVLDNSDRDYYNHIKDLHDTAKWKKIDFCGPVPYTPDFSKTTFYLRLSPNK